MGFRREGIIQAIFMPLFLTMILFLGPLSTKIVTGLFKLYVGEFSCLMLFSFFVKVKFQSLHNGKKIYRT